MFIQQLINGLSVGSVYALMAVGYALIYSLLNFTNFAHSITVTIGAFTTFFFLTYAMENLFLGIVAGIAVAAILAAFIEFIAYRPLLKRNARRVYLMIIGLGISVMGDNLIIIAFSGRFRIFPVNFPAESIQILGANIGVVDLLIFFVSMAALLIVEWIIKKTKLGLAIRSASYSLEATSLMGVDTFKLILSIFLIAGSLAGVAGTLLGAKYTTYPSLGTFYTNKAFICAVFGGLGKSSGCSGRSIDPGSVGGNDFRLCVYHIERFVCIFPVDCYPADPPVGSVRKIQRGQGLKEGKKWNIG